MKKYFALIVITFASLTLICSTVACKGQKVEEKEAAKIEKTDNETE